MRQLADNSTAFVEEIEEEKHCKRWVLGILTSILAGIENDQVQRLEENRREWELKLEGMNREFLAGWRKSVANGRTNPASGLAV